MAYRFDPSRPIDEEFRRIYLELIGLARRHLTETADRHEAVHEARRAFKKLRGLLRLARPALNERYEIENVRWRDASRELSSLRDATALIECFDELQKAYAPFLKSGALSGLRAALVERRATLAAHERGLEARIRHVLGELEKGEAEVGAMRLPADNPAPLASGLAHVYGQALKRYREAAHQMTDEGMHDWRKRIKYHWMHLQLLRDVWPAPVRARMKDAKKLSDLIGDDHDLVVLQALVDTEPELFDPGPAPSLLLALAARRQIELRAAALHYGGRLCDRDPRWFALRIDLVWREAMARHRAPAPVSPSRLPEPA